MATSSTTFKKTDVDQNGQLNTDKYNQNQGNIADDRNRLSNVIGPHAATTALAPAAQIDTGQSNEARAAQNTLVSQLQGQANGTGPSVAGSLLKAATDRNLAGQASLAAAAPQGGTNPALAARQLAQNTTMANQNLAQQLATQRMQEQIAAQNSLGNVLSGQRSQDIGLAANQAGLAQQTALQQGSMDQARALANLQAGLTTNGQNITAAQGFDQLGLGSINAQTGAVFNSNNQNIAQSQWQQEQQAAQDRANNAAINGLIGAGIGAAGSIATGGLSGKL